MGVIDRIGQWSEIQQVRPAQEPPEEAAGRAGELALRELVGASYRLKGASVLAGRRIPSRRQGRRREIDLIVCTPEMVHLIEAKNWSGRVEVVNGDWRQTRRSGEVVGHGDLLGDLRRKRDAVAEYLDDRGVALDERFVRDRIAPKIIFTSPNLRLDPEVEARPDVISRRELDGYLGRQRRKALAERTFSAFIEFCLDWEGQMAGERRSAASGRMPQDLCQKIVECLSEAGTWDRLEFYGGRVVTGDVLDLKVGPRTYRRPGLGELAGRLPIHLRWTRSRGLGLLKAVTGLGSLGSMDLGNSRIGITPGDTVTFHAVGESEPYSRRLVELDRIVLG